jgi:hypothetical protein
MCKDNSITTNTGNNLTDIQGIFCSYDIRGDIAKQIDTRRDDIVELGAFCNRAFIEFY